MGAAVAGAAPDPEAPVVAAYLLVLFGLFVAFRRGIAFVGFLAGVADTPMVRVVTRTAFWAIAVRRCCWLAHADRFGTSERRRGVWRRRSASWRSPIATSELDDVIAVAGALALALLASWNLPLPTPEMNYWVFRLQPDHVAQLHRRGVDLRGCCSAAAALPRCRGCRGRAAGRRCRRRRPSLILIIAYWRLQKFELDIAWTLMALALAGAELAAAASVAKRRTGDFEIEVALAAYAVGVLGSTITAAAFGLAKPG